MKNKYTGVFPALVTPFDENGKVKYSELEKIVKYLIEVQKVDGLYVTGSTGEFLLLSAEERKKIFDVVAKVAKGKITLIAQVGELNITHTIEMAKHAEKVGFDAISAITPYYYVFGFDEVKAYYEKVAKSTKLDLFIYYLPQLAGGKMSLGQFSELLELENVAGAKYGAMDIYFFERLLKRNPHKTFFYAWDEALSLGALLGAKGFIGSTYNTNAEGVRKILKAMESNDLELVRKLVHEYNDYIDLVVSTGLMQSLKYIIKRETGIDAGYNKLPFRKVDEKVLDEMYKKFKTLVK